MPVPVSQMWTVATYVLKQKLKAKALSVRFMLEPLFPLQSGLRGLRQNPIPRAHPENRFEPEECFKAVDECGTPMVSIPAASL